MVRYYVNLRTGTVHQVGEGMLEPLRKGHTNCGKPMKNMRPVKFARSSGQHLICKRCEQLTGE